MSQKAAVAPLRGKKGMDMRKGLVCLVLVMGMLLPGSRADDVAATLELYGTFEAMGVIVTLASADDPDGDAVAAVAYRTGSDAYGAGFPLSRVADTRLVGSLFWLDPDTVYDVRVTLSDPDGDPVDGTVLEGAATTRPEIVVPVPNNSVYVRPDGSGTDCSLASPCALGEGLAQAQPGDEVVLRGGVYYEGEMDFPRSGVAGAPIVVRGYDGETAVLDGSDPDTFTWTAYGSGVYYTTVNVADPHLVTADGARLFPYDDLTDLQNLSRDDMPGFYAVGTTVYVHLAGDANPNDAFMAVSRYNYAFTVEQDYVYLIDLTFRHYGQGAYAKAIYFNNASDNLVQGCVFAANDLGIGLKRESHRNVIQENEFYDTIFGWRWEHVKDVGGLEDGGVAFYDPVTGRGNVIRRNLFHDDFDGFSVCPSWTAAVTNETDVYENLVYNMGDDGVETDGQCSNVRIWGNAFHDVLVGISLAPVYDGPVYAIRNLVYRTGVGNNAYSGTPFKFNSGYDRSGPMYLFHNTADAALPGNDGLDIRSPGSWEVILSRNNAWAGTAYALSNDNPGEPLDLDYDDLYTTLAGELVWWDGLPDRHLNTLAEFQANTGQEPHGLNVEPGFSDPDNGDYELGAASALIDEGILIPGINDAFTGTAPDIGAFEYTEEGFTLNAIPSTRAIDPGGVATFLLSVEPAGGFSQTVSLSAASPSPSLKLQLVPASVAPPGQATLTVTDTHVAEGPTLMPGLWYTLPITGSGGGFIQATQVGLLVGGARVYLPLTVKD